MSYQFYKLMHFVGIFLLFIGFGVILVNALLSTPTKTRLLGIISHGIGLVLILVGGFGMAARLGLVQGLPTWIYVKIAIWLVLGLAYSLFKRLPKLYLAWTSLTVILALAAAYTALFKPF